MAVSSKRTEKLDLRLASAAKRQLQAAAKAESRSVSEYVLESALARAQESLTNRQRFDLSATQWAAFMTALDAPPKTLPRLAKLLREQSIFEAKKNL